LDNIIREADDKIGFVASFVGPTADMVQRTKLSIPQLLALACIQKSPVGKVTCKTAP
jgi:hypothetical protein